VIEPDWPAPPRVRALVTTRDFGDLADEGVRRKLRGLLPAEPSWLKQVHGQRVIDLDRHAAGEADASVTRQRGTVAVVKAADCMPVLFADVDGTTVAAAHAGWRGLAGGVLEETVRAMGIPPHKIIAWLGPAIGPRVYEVGKDVREAFSGYPDAFVRRVPDIGCSTCTRWRARSCAGCGTSAAAAFALTPKTRASSRIAAIAPVRAWQPWSGLPSVESSPP